MLHYARPAPAAQERLGGDLQQASNQGVPRRDTHFAVKVDIPEGGSRPRCIGEQ